MKKNIYVHACVIPVLFVGMLSAGIGMRLGYDRSGPFLYGPCTENIALKGKSDLEFRWKRNGDMNVRTWNLKIYKGYDTTADNLIMRKEVEGSRSSVSIPVDNFEKGQIYSWEIYKVLYGGEKSTRSYCSFSISPK